MKIVMIIPFLMGLAGVGLPASAQDKESLPGTQPFRGPADDGKMADALMNGAHRFVERKIEESFKTRRRHWKRDFASPEAYARSIQPNRARFRTIIGAVDPRLPADMEFFGNKENPALVAETKSYMIHQVRWPVLPGVYGEGLRVTPKGVKKPRACVVVLPEADRTPEQLMGLAPGVDPELQYARRLAENGILVVLSAPISRAKLTEPALRRSDQTHREWIYRQAFHMGRHVIGFEVQRALGVVDWFRNRYGGNISVGIAGDGEGALVAFYAAAVDPRIDASFVSGYFDSRQGVWSEPIYRNVWGLLREFGDAEVASLIAPRRLVIEYSKAPEIESHKGDIVTPDFDRVSGEWKRIPRNAFLPEPRIVHSPGGKPIGPGSAPALQGFAESLGIDRLLPLSGTPPSDRRKRFDPAGRELRLFRQLESHVQGLVRRSEHVRDRFFMFKIMPELARRKWTTEKSLPTHSAKKFIEGARSYRKLFHEEGMGRFDEPLLPPNPRTRKILENDRWTAYDVVLDVYPELIAWGVLVIPRDLREGERRPVVVCQHGRNGLPRSTIDRGTTAYNDFAAKLAERGFVTFSPHNLYRGEDRYRILDRKANSVRATLFSFIIAQHDQILRWLGSLPFVDGDRIAFYGLSYGGETAVRVPTILEKYCLSICSGDFNQWTRKVASTDQPFTFMNTIEWEMPYWNLGHTFDYAEMSYLMLPRPFMVERGHKDLVGRDRWVAHEFAKVRWLNAQLGLEDRIDIEYFQGGHSINGRGAFRFLHRHLDWPAPKQEKD